MRTAHHDRNATGANGIGDAIRLRDHSGHGADADNPDVLFADVSRDLTLVHWLSITVNQQNFMTRRSQGLEQEHPQVRHEIASHTVVGVVEQDSHDSS